MTAHYAELLMYNAPARVRESSEAWLARILRLLGSERSGWHSEDLYGLWLQPRLLLAQTCGYPLVSRLHGKVRLLGRPHYQLADSQDGWHCSLLLVRRDDPRQTLDALYGSRGVVNGFDSNSGMNLLRHSLAPLQRDGRFFAQLQVSGSHRESLRRVAEGQADLAAVDSVTFAYLARFAPQEVAGVHILARSAPSPTLPYIGAASLDEGRAEAIRAAMNEALAELPEVAAILALTEVLPAKQEDYRVLLDYQNEARALGYPTLA